MSIQFNSMAIVVAALCVSLSASSSPAKANDFQSALNNHLTSGAILLAQGEDPVDLGFKPEDFELGELKEVVPVQALSGGDDIEARKKDAEMEMQKYLDEKKAAGQ